MNTETSRLNKQRCDILVGFVSASSKAFLLSYQLTIQCLCRTPGRMIDHLENGNLKAKLANVKCLILDEADRLLEQGFRRELTNIIGCLPNRAQRPRQTLLFSATIPAQVHQVSRSPSGRSPSN